jgi:hypothetical protein
MPRSVRQHHHWRRRHLLFQVHRQGHRQAAGWLGVYNPETFNVEDARTKVYGLKARGGTAVVESLRQHKVQKAKAGLTVGEIIEERIEWMKTPVRKEDGETRARIESWSTVASHLRRLVKPRLGDRLASEITNDHIAELFETCRRTLRLSGVGGRPEAAFVF